MNVGGAAQRSIFAGYHPLINYLFFGYVILVTAFFLHPVYLVISFAGALSYSLYLSGRRTRKFHLCFVLPLMVVAAAFTPAFNHRGATVLAFLPGGSPLTLESVLYGVSAAVMIGAVILWFSCYNALMTSDKFIYLFGRLWPAMSLIISMALRFIPRYGEQIRRIASGRRGIGMGVSSGGGFLARVRAGAEILSVMVTWALENAIETSDSMRSRGYGQRGRTTYSDYRFDGRDRALVIVFLALMAVAAVSALTGVVRVMYYPVYAEGAWTPLAVCACACHAAACFLPLALELREDALWRKAAHGID
jgi:energy-coupling factor transport system permease protein